MPNIWASLNVPFIHFLLQFFPNSNSKGLGETEVSVDEDVTG
jgi:hypothetical protein